MVDVSINPLFSVPIKNAADDIWFGNSETVKAQTHSDRGKLLFEGLNVKD